MKEIFYTSPHNAHRRYDIFVHLYRQTTKYGGKSLIALRTYL